MKLKRLKLLSQFRSLPEGFEIEFRQKEPGAKSFEPLCLVGLNGSGKSNVLQAIGEIFFYLEMYCLSAKEEKLKMNNMLGFEIEYILSLQQKQEAGLQRYGRGQPYHVDAEYVGFLKKPKELPIFVVTNPPGLFGNGPLENEFKDENDDPNYTYKVNFTKVLPIRVIGYSSGMNELISNAFIKIDFHYFDSFQKSIERQEYGIWEMNRMFFMDYESNKMVVLCNYLFWDRDDIEKQKKLGILNEELGIVDIERFSITLRFTNFNHQELKLTSQLLLAVERLKQCATTWYDNQETLADDQRDKRVLRMDFLVDGATRKAFRSYFKTAQLLYRDFYLLRLLNTEMFGEDLQEEVRKSGPDINLSALIPKLPAQQMIFSIDDIALKKRNATKPVYYRQLSDGEHQLLHVLGSIMLMEWPGTLFIMDEPETHFNPEWRSKFVSLLNKISEAEEIAREQDIVLTSHSPFIVSDCKQENVFIFKRNEQTRMVEKPLNPDFNTYGSSVNLITSKVFGKTETIAGMANDVIINLRGAVENKTKTIEQAKDEVNTLGDSIEKIIFLDELSKIKQ